MHTWVKGTIHWKKCCTLPHLHYGDLYLSENFLDQNLVLKAMLRVCGLEIQKELPMLLGTIIKKTGRNYVCTSLLVVVKMLFSFTQHKAKYDLWEPQRDLIKNEALLYSVDNKHFYNLLCMSLSWWSLVSAQLSHSVRSWIVVQPKLLFIAIRVPLHYQPLFSFTNVIMGTETCAAWMAT